MDIITEYVTDTTPRNQKREEFPLRDEKIRVLIVENQFLVTESLKIVLTNDKFGICRVEDSWDSLENEMNFNDVDLVITDHTLMHTAPEKIQAIKQKNAGIAILILTNHITHDELKALIRAGIKNIIYKTADRDELLSVVEATLKGKKYFSGEILGLLMELGDKNFRKTEVVHLTQTEKEIVKLIVEGFSTKAIAEHKNISFHTVSTHRKNIFRKINVKNASELFHYALKAGLIAPCDV
ncbi:MAG TPA: response regulator transcription factor [Bacteroidales bacterium]|nr:response regulator transcription factor [Bacteroidales bacterium]